jgi:pimeloyl-ACP methyl ester carboxylesterase
MARSVIDVTGAPAYLALVRAVIARGIPLYLVVGERSAPGWDVPDWVRVAAQTTLVLPGTGHMMMLEDPDAFSRNISALVRSSHEVTN